jgi:hypothetical protein
VVTTVSEEPVAFVFRVKMNSVGLRLGYQEGCKKGCHLFLGIEEMRWDLVRLIRVVTV